MRWGVRDEMTNEHMTKNNACGTHLMNRMLATHQKILLQQLLLQFWQLLLQLLLQLLQNCFLMTHLMLKLCPLRRKKYRKLPGYAPTTSFNTTACAFIR